MIAFEKTLQQYNFEDVCWLSACRLEASHPYHPHTEPWPTAQCKVRAHTHTQTHTHTQIHIHTQTHKYCTWPCNCLLAHECCLVRQQDHGETISSSRQLPASQQHQSRSNLFQFSHGHLFFCMLFLFADTTQMWSPRKLQGQAPLPLKRGKTIIMWSSCSSRY